MKRLDTSLATDLSSVIREALDDAGFQSAEENIPGLIQAVVDYAQGDDQLLDEASDLLADGGVDN